MLEVEQVFMYSSKDQGIQDPTVPLLCAKALLPATIVTVLHLYRMVYPPPAKITSSQHQAFMAAWQLAPFFCYCAMAGIILFFTPSTPPKTKMSPRSRNADMPWVKTIFAVFGLFSAAMHLAVLWELAITTNLTVTHEAVFIPQLHKFGYPDTAATLFDEERKYFLQWDYVIIHVAAAIYVTATLNRMYGFGDVQKVVVFAMASIASHVVSFGTVLAIVLFLRESFVREQIVSTEEKGKSNSKHSRGCFAIISREILHLSVKKL
jgi:hypothetical protein